VDRIRSAELLDETAPDRAFEEVAPHLPELITRRALTP